MASNTQYTHEQMMEMRNFWYNTVATFALIAFGFCVTFFPIGPNNDKYANLVIGLFIGSLLGRLINTQLNIGKTEPKKSGSVDGTGINQPQQNQ